MVELKTVARYLLLMNDLSPEHHDKYKAYRARKRAAGLREVRMWVPDVNAPGFQARLNRAVEAINRSEDSKRVLREMEDAIGDAWSNAS